MVNLSLVSENLFLLKLLLLTVRYKYQQQFS